MCIVIIGLTTSGRKAWQEEEETKDTSIVLILQEQFCTSELIPDGVFKHIYHVRYAINLHSIINSGLIPGGQNLSKRQKYFSACGSCGQKHKDLDTIDLEAARLAQYMHIALKKHQNTVYWVDINLALKKELKFHQTRSNAIIFHETLPAHCMMKELEGEVARQPEGEVARQPEGEVARQTKSSQSTKPKPNPIHDRTVRPVVCSQRASQTFFSRDRTNFNLEEINDDSTEKPVVCSQSERSMLKENDIDLRISSLPHSVVKQAENY